MKNATRVIIQGLRWWWNVILP